MVAFSKATGSGEQIWPKNTNIEDIQSDLFHAIEHALLILNWKEFLTEEEMPKSWMWHLDWELEPWFIRIQNNRDAKYNKSSSDDDDDDNDGYWEENIYADMIKNG